MPSTPEELRSLDVEIARVVFKIKRLYGFDGQPWDGVDNFPQYIPSGKPWHGHQIDARTLPWFSRDIAAAWTVVERLREIGMGIVIGNEPDGWEVEITTTETLYQQGYRGCYSRHAPIAEAICRAALAVFARAAEPGQGK